jgi:regulator of nucleoside diphosphate kinase
MSSSRRRIVLSRFDQQRLLDAIGKRSDLDELRDEIEDAEVLDAHEMPSDVVTMNSVVRFTDEVSGEETEATVVFPGNTDGGRNRVSVFAPIGSALLGLRVGESIDWPLPGGRTARLRVTAVTYQPEAAGDMR